MKCLEIQTCKECESPMSLLWVNLNKKVNMCTSDSCDFPFNQDDFEDYCEILPKECHKLFHPEFKNSKPIELDQLLLISEEKESIILQCQDLVKADPIPELPTIDLSEFDIPPLPDAQKWESGLKFYHKPEPLPSEENEFSERELSESYYSDSNNYTRESSPASENPYFNIQTSGSPINSFPVADLNSTLTVKESFSPKLGPEIGSKSTEVINTVEVPSASSHGVDFSQNNQVLPAELQNFIISNFNEISNGVSASTNNTQDSLINGITSEEQFSAFGSNPIDIASDEAIFDLPNEFFSNLF